MIAPRCTPEGVDFPPAYVIWIYGWYAYVVAGFEYCVKVCSHSMLTRGGRARLCVQAWAAGCLMIIIT